MLLAASMHIASCASPSEPVEVAGPAAEARTPEPTIATGTIRRWPEATEHLRFDVSSSAISADMGAPRPAGLDAFWSIASTEPGSGFFYSDAIRGTSETRVAHAANVRRVAEIRDASALDFTRESVGPIAVGEIVVIEHEPTRRYLAIVVDAIEPTDPRTAGAGPYAYADVTWYLTPPGQKDFGGQ
jgi:hypothetical protein